MQITIHNVENRVGTFSDENVCGTPKTTNFTQLYIIQCSSVSH